MEIYMTYRGKDLQFRIYKDASLLLQTDHGKVNLKYTSETIWLCEISIFKRNTDASEYLQNEINK